MTTYLSFRGTTTGPLFQYLFGALSQKRNFFETKQLLSMSALQPAQEVGHSCKIGATTTSASVGLPASLSKH